MEQSDGLLLTSLREFMKIPEKVVDLKDVRGEEVFLISIGFLECLGVDSSEIQQLSNKSQRFRSMAKLNQSLYQQLQTQFELNELMNPSISFLRKFLLTLINRIASIDQADRNKSKKYKADNRESKNQQNGVKKWLAQEWVHPSLLPSRQKYRSHILPLTISKNMLRSNINISAELNNPLLGSNVQTVLGAASAKHQLRIRQFEANEGIARREHEEAALASQTVLKANKSDWTMAENKLKKIKRKVVEEISQESIIIVSEPTVFQTQVEAAVILKKEQVQEVKQIRQVRAAEEGILESPIQKLKREAEARRESQQAEIRQVQAQLKRRKQAVERWEDQRRDLEGKIANDEQKIAKTRQQTIDLKKKVEKRQTILNSLEQEKDVEGQVKKLEGEIELIEGQVKEQVGRIENQMKVIQTESKEKMEALGDLKAKLAKIEYDYQAICEQIQQKNQMKGGVKIQKSGISRLYYSKKISQIESRWRQTQKQTRKLRFSLEQARQKARVSGTLNQRVETEIQNLLTMDKSKFQAQNKVLKGLMKNCQEFFGNTMKTLEQINQIKSQTQEFQMKVHTLSGKNYKQNIERINFAMEDLKKELTQASRMSRGK